MVAHRACTETKLLTGCLWQAIRRQHPEAVEQQITFMVEAASESELKLILTALERGQGVWTIPKRYTVKQTTNSPRAGRRFQATVKLAIRAALKDTG